MTFQFTIFEEPLLEFRYGQTLEDPHDGLYLFGPYDADLSSHPKKITYGTIGTENGIALFEKWSEQVLNAPQISEPDKLKLWPPYPGFDVAFDCEWPNKASWTYTLDEKELLKASRHKDEYTRTYEVVNIFMEAFEVLGKRDESFNVIVCIVPEEIYKNCRPKARPDDVWGHRPTSKQINDFKKGQVTLFEEFSSKEHWTTDKYKMSVDFRRQIKARALKYNIPIQIIRETTLSLKNRGDNNRRLTCLSDRAWNLSTALYYKAGGKPWKLASAREGVCYIGISFKRVEDADERTACCAAQMFLDSGDGIVFLGDKGPWYSPEKKQFELSKDAAYNLLSGILRTYEDLGGQELKELFIHCRSSINEEAFEGYKEACPDDVKLVCVRVRKERNDLKLYRPGKMPIIRGSFLKWDDRTGYLWGTGFKPRIGTYDGWEVPVPLRIQIQYGDSSIEQVARDIFSLTKLNYNACKLGDSEPVTIMFSDAVGEILVSNPKIKDRKPQFKFYI